MENETLQSRKFAQTTLGEKDNGLWKLTVVITETLVYPDGNVKEEKIESMCLDSDFDKAHQIALHSALSELRGLVYDNGFDSLIEAREHERKLEAQDNDLSTTNEDTTTQ